MERLEFQVASDAKAIIHLATLVKDYLSNSLHVVTENGELRKRVNAMDGKAFEPVSSAVQRLANVSAMAEEQDALAAKCKELALKVQCMPVMSEEDRTLCARVAESREAFKKKASKVRSKHRTAEMEMVAEQARIEHVEHTTWTMQSDRDLHELKGKLNFSEHCNNVTD